MKRLLGCGQRWGIGALCLMLVGAVGCDEYDPPPEVTMPIPAGGRWDETTPLELVFSEPIDRDSLAITVWSLDRCDAFDQPEGCNFSFEGEFKEAAKPLVDGCTIDASPCGPGGLAIVLDEDRTEATVAQGESLTDHRGVPLMLDVHAGLADDAGRTRDVVTRFPFQITPQAAGQEIDIELNSNVIAMTADLTSVLPTYLRMYIDLGIDRTDGTVYAFGNYAQPKKDQDYPPNDANWEHMQLVRDDTAWSVGIAGAINEQGDGTFFLQTVPFDLVVYAMGIIRVEMESLRLEGTITPGGRADGRDGLEGIMLADEVLVGEGEDQTAFGEAAAPWEATGLFVEDLPEGMARVCDSDPCQLLREVSGDCQIPETHTPPAYCEAAPDPGAQP